MKTHMTAGSVTFQVIQTRPANVWFLVTLKTKHVISSYAEDQTNCRKHSGPALLIKHDVCKHDLSGVCGLLLFLLPPPLPPTPNIPNKWHPKATKKLSTDTTHIIQIVINFCGGFKDRQLRGLSPGRWGRLRDVALLLDDQRLQLVASRQAQQCFCIWKHNTNREMFPVLLHLETQHREMFPVLLHLETQHKQRNVPSASGNTTQTEKCSQCFCIWKHNTNREMFPVLLHL